MTLIDLLLSIVVLSVSPWFIRPTFFVPLVSLWFKIFIFLFKATRQYTALFVRFLMVCLDDNRV